MKQSWLNYLKNKKIFKILFLNRGIIQKLVKMAKQARTKAVLSSNLEKVLISVILGSIIAWFIVTGERDLKTGYLYKFVLLTEIALIVYYIYITKNAFSIFLVGFIILNIGYFDLTYHHAIAKKIIIAGEISQFLLGVLLGYKAFLESKKNKDWEMYGTLVALALMFPILNEFIFRDRTFMMIYHYALPFLLGIIIYNENLWDKYNDTEKKILTYVVVSSVAEVLFLSLKLV